MTRLTDSAPVPASATLDSCVWMIERTSLGTVPRRLSTWSCTVAGEATSPYSEMAAISVGKMARNPKKATPPPMIGMLSALFSAHARLRICCHPRRGISVGLSASTPGNRASWPLPLSFAFLRRSVAVRAGPRSSARSAASRAAARRAAFSSTRWRMRSTALSGRLMPSMGRASLSRPARSRSAW